MTTSDNYLIIVTNGGAISNWPNPQHMTLNGSLTFNFNGAIACEGDFDTDKDVDGSDLAVFASDFVRTDCDVGDPFEGEFDEDNDVDGSDLAVFAADFGRTDCP